eukprot:c7521_g1_i1.p1 GENE.c7521_g1_i1~~c7521_g1_i1.p1  ORF type:complete len:394 (+),score=87.45 c7521_g1_i1:456-1637(+)
MLIEVLASCPTTSDQLASLSPNSQSRVPKKRKGASCPPLPSELTPPRPISSSSSLTATDSSSSSTNEILPAPRPALVSPPVPRPTVPLVPSANEAFIGLGTIPDDPLRIIFQHCDGRSLQALELACKRFYKMVQPDERLWRSVCAQEMPFRLLGMDSEEALLWRENKGNTVTWRRMFGTCSNILANDLISCTGLTPEKKNAQRDLIVSMGGRYQGHLDRKVTVLVVAQAGTDKFRFAQNEQIKMVTEQWVRDCFINRQRMLLNSYFPPLFIGLKFCATQIQAGVRAFIEDEATKRGGEYTADLRKDHNTHLIAVRPEGRKFEFAHRWRMKVVSPKWFFECLELDEFVEETEFSIPMPPIPVAPAILPADPSCTSHPPLFMPNPLPPLSHTNDS